MTSPGAGNELKHLLDNVKSKTSKLEGLDLKAKCLSKNDKGLDTKDEGKILQAKGFNLKALGEAIKGANSNRQTVAVWSPTISATLWYLKKTTPEFSISDEARIILEEGLRRKYPQLFQRIKEEMGQKQKAGGNSGR